MAQFQSVHAVQAKSNTDMENLKTELKSDRQSGLQSMRKLTADLGSDLQTMKADLHAEMTIHGSELKSMQKSMKTQAATIDHSNEVNATPSLSASTLLGGLF